MRASCGSGVSLKPIYLIGPRGAGKSTIARLLAARIDRPFFDQDHIFESRHGSIPALFKRHTRTWIVDRLARTLDEVEPEDVVAMSGSSLLDDGKVNATRCAQVRRGIVVLLLPGKEHRRNIEILLRRERARKAYAVRKETSAKNYHERLPLYQKLADHTVYADGDSELTVRRILRALQRS